MPIDVIRVKQVTSQHVKGDQWGEWRVKYSVHAEMVEGERFAPIFDTFDVWKATLALRAKELNQPVEIGSRETRYGPEIVSIELTAPPPAPESEGHSGGERETARSPKPGDSGDFPARVA